MISKAMVSGNSAIKRSPHAGREGGIIVRLHHAALIICFLLISGTSQAAEKAASREHGRNMEHCMPGMEAHCRMNEAMKKMTKEMEAHRSMQHCMPDMTAHCQMISDLEYMGNRMENMRANMQHCIENAEDCPMPEMTGEMMAMRANMTRMEKEMQKIIQPAPKKGQGQIDTLHEQAESHQKP